MYKIFPKNKARFLFRIVDTGILLILVLAVLVPITDIFLRSVSRNGAPYVSGFATFKQEFGEELMRGMEPVWFGFYKRFLSYEYIQGFIKTSIVTTFATVFFGLVVSTISAYILTRRDMPGVKIFKWLLLFTLVFDAGMLPRFIVIRKMDLLNTYWPMIVYLGFNVYNIMIMRAYFEKLPKELFEAATIDGCSPVRAFYGIALPLARAPLTAVGIMLAAAAWNEYISYVMYISDTRKYNLQYYIRYALAYSFFYNHDISCAPIYPEMSVISVYIILAAIPSVIMSILFSKSCKACLETACIKE